MRTEWGFMALRADKTRPDDDRESVFKEEYQALNHAREQARRFNVPYAVYKIVQTHYVKPIEPEIREVRNGVVE